MSEGNKRPHDPWSGFSAQENSVSPSPAKRARTNESYAALHPPPTSASTSIWDQPTSAPSSSSNFSHHISQPSLIPYPYPVPTGEPQEFTPLTPQVNSMSLNEMSLPLPVRPASAAASMGRSFSLPAGPSTPTQTLPGPPGAAAHHTQAQNRQAAYRSSLEYSLPFEVPPHPSIAGPSSASNPNMAVYGISSASTSASSSGPSSATMSRHSSSRGVTHSTATGVQNRAFSATPTARTSLIPSMAPPYPPTYSYPTDQPSPRASSSTPMSQPPHYSHHRLPPPLPQEATPLSSAATTSPSPPLRSAVHSLTPPLEQVSGPVSSMEAQDEGTAAQSEGKKGKGKHKGIPGPKARIPLEAKQAIGEHIIAKGVAMANVEELAQLTGLTKQQIKSQLVDNRQNVRKQLTEFVRSLQ
ncbi:hypothetical protein IAT40_004809 [Kwoniella sp. CBS 6097]